MRSQYNSTRRLFNGFSLIELLVSLTLSLLMVSFLFELLLANQRVLKTQADLTTLATRISKVSSIFRHEIHRSQGNINITNNQLTVSYLNQQEQLIKHRYLIEANRLVMINHNGRKTRLVEEVSNMKIVRYLNGIDIIIQVKAGLIGKEIHVFTSLS